MVIWCQSSIPNTFSWKSLLYRNWKLKTTFSAAWVVTRRNLLTIPQMYCKLEHQKEGTGLLSFPCFHWQTRSGQNSFSWDKISSSCNMQLLASWRSKVWGICSAGMGDGRHALVLMLGAIVVNACLLLGCKTGNCVQFQDC